MNTKLESFVSQVRKLGVYIQEMDNEIFIDDRDVTKAQAKKIRKISDELGLTIHICDKGAAFEG